MLESYGWSRELQAQFDPYAARALVPARVTVQQRGVYTLVGELGELSAELAGRFAFEAESGDYPVAGDWVAAAARPDEGTATSQELGARQTPASKGSSAGPAPARGTWRTLCWSGFGAVGAVGGAGSLGWEVGSDMQVLALRSAGSGLGGLVPAHGELCSCQ